jgi:hypothetical protein
VSPFADQQ